MTRWLIRAGVVLAVLAVSARVIAQPAGDAGRVAGPAADVSIELAEFGFGGLARPGGWAGLRVVVRDRSPSPREILLRATLTDADGDQPEYQTVISGADAQGRSAWVYVALPASFAPSSTILLEAFEAIEPESPDALPGPGELLAKEIVDPASMTDSRVTPNFADLEEGLIAVLGTRPLGLRDYTAFAQGTNWLALGHEAARLGLVPTATQLPDRWLGFSQLDVLVWYDADPAAVGPDARRALIEWVRRGGHLVVVLGASQQAWAIGPGNPLSDLLPRARAQRVEQVRTQDYLRLIATAADSGPRRDPAVYAFEPLGAWDAREAAPILSDAEGRVVVVRRLLGVGMVTQVGIDLGDPALGTLPRGDRFWNRVLGKSPLTPTVEQLNVLGATAQGNLRNRQPAWYDMDVPGEISLTGRAAAGLLLGAVVFSVYWLLAGPPGFRLLKRRRAQRHAWVVFFGLAVVFTAIAWTAAWALRPKQIMAQHVTLLDHVFASENQQARAWLGLLVPQYGDATLEVGLDDANGTGGQRAFTDAASPWQARGFSGIGRFPDARGYAISSRKPDRVSFPARSTVKQLVVDWAGPPLAGGAMPRPIGGGSTPTGANGPVLSVDAQGLPVGVLAHNLGGDLESVLVIVNPGQRSIDRGSGGELTVPWFERAKAYSVPRWPAGTALDLARVAQDNRGNPSELFVFMGDLLPTRSVALGAARSEQAPGNPEDRFAALALFDLLPPPSLQGNEIAIPIVARRWSTHGLDLSRWLTQPCIVVIGHLKQSASPVPMSVNGEPLASTGRTVVRWVYPLEPSPPAWDAER